MLKELLKRFEDEFVGQSRVWEPVNDSIYCGRMSDAEIEGMRQRNEKAIKECIEKMGERWILHPVHKVGRIDERQ